MKIVLLILAAIPFAVNAERVFLDVKVVDEQGVGISNAVVSVSTQKKLILGYGSHPSHFQWTSNVTDVAGMSVLRFRCLTADFECYVEASGYYSERNRSGRFAATGNGLFGMNFLQTRTNMTFMLRKIINPVPMFSYSMVADQKVPDKVGVFGFDLQKNAWVHPWGKGEIADFEVDYRWDLNDGILVAHANILFPEKDTGAYIDKKINSLYLQSAYAADTNRVFLSKLESSIYENIKKPNDNRFRNILNEEEYLVLRTRVMHDDSGNIVSANYSKIYGPFIIGRYIRFGQISFNPNPNDVNLEFDVKRNLNKKPRGTTQP